MKHKKSNKRLGRDTAARTALFKNLAKALISKESITTTRIKAKEAQSYIEKLITVAKNNTPESKRYIFGILTDKALIDILFNDIAPRFKTRPGGYTRVIPLYPRKGDGSPMAILELVEKKPKPLHLKKAKKEEPKKEETKPHAAPQPKLEAKEEIQKEKAKEEIKKVQKQGILKNLRRFFRGKAPS